jgi:hypothetical protein
MILKNISIIQILSSLTLKINLKTYFEAVINKATKKYRISFTNHITMNYLIFFSFSIFVHFNHTFL